jgi:hypothetical protein
MARGLSALALVAAGLGAQACVTAGGPAARAASPAAAVDTNRFLVPAGYGTLHQEDIAVRLQVLGLQVRAIPLDESVIRLLSPDSYRTLQGLATSQQETLESVSQRTSLRRLSLWYVTFTGLEQGETPFSPQEFQITSVGRDFHPIEVIPITTGFGQQRLRQRETQSAMYVFDPQVDVNQPLTVQFQTARSTDWSLILSRIERERALVRSRAGIRQPPLIRHSDRLAPPAPARSDTDPVHPGRLSI